MATREPTNKEYVEFFFTKRDGKMCCNMCDCKRKLQSNGYTNYKNHLDADHPDYKEKYLSERKIASQENRPMERYVKKSATKKAQTIWSWIDWIVEENLPFSSVNSASFRQYSNLESIDRHTLASYMEKLYLKVQERIKAKLKHAKTFGLIIDGWAHESDHYMAIFATFVEALKNRGDQVVEYLLSCNVQEDITDDTEFVEGVNPDHMLFGLTAEDLFDHIVAVLHDEYSIEVNYFT
jgi:hypothetical protein